MNKVKILLNRQEAIGDVLMTTPILKQLFLDYNGNCEIDFFVKSTSKEVVENNPYVNQIYTRLPSNDDLKNYDRYINLDLVYEKNPKVHAIDAYGLETFGHTDFDHSLEFYTTATDKLQADLIANSVNTKYIVIHVRKWYGESRNLSEVFWQKFVQHILTNSNLSIIQIGLVGEPVFFGNDRIINKLGKLTISELKEVIENSQCYVGTDSGPAHIASSTKIPMVVLYTSVRQEYRQPLRHFNKFLGIAADIECYGCQEHLPPCTPFICKRGDMECVNRFDPTLVAEKVIEMIS